MRRTIAGTAAALVTALMIGGPMASAGHAAPTTLQCGGSAPAAECELLADLAAQLGPIAPLLGTALAPLAGEAQDLAARSDSASGVPTAEVVDVSEALLSALAGLPAPVQTIVGATSLGQVTDTLQALVDSLTAPVSGGQQSSGGSTVTPAKTTSSSPTAAPVGGARSRETSRVESASTGGSTSTDPVPDVPVGDPLTLAPLALPAFGFDAAFAPAVTTDAAAPSAADVEMAVAEVMGGESPGAELAVVVVLSLLLLAGAGIAQLQANRHQIAD